MITHLSAGNIHARWGQMDQAKANLKWRCEQYAGWTLPYIFPPENSKDDELQQSFDSLGARATNNLSNKIAMTLFNPYGSFFRLNLTQEVETELDALPEEKRAQVKLMAETTFAKTEKNAMKQLERMSYRTAAVMACKQLIITGNALLFHPEKGAAQAYNLRNYCVARDCEGVPVEIIMRDRKAFETFSPEVQEQIMTSMGGPMFIRGQHQDITLYTYVSLETDGKYHVRQCTEHVMLAGEAMYPRALMPWVPLTWNLVRGEDYGRGLVEDFAGAFHALEVLTEALATGAAISADIKILVDPASGLDPEELNRSPTGSYHVGREGDLTYPQLGKQQDFSLAQAIIDRLVKEISQAFMLLTTRDAERVTTVEIKKDAQELETSLGGIYSRLAEEWQGPCARLILDKIQFDIGTERAVEPMIVTGLDGLARLGDLDNIQMFIQDMALWERVPEEARAYVKWSDFMRVCGNARGVDYTQFIMTENEKRQADAYAMQQQQAMMAAQGQQDMAVAAGKQAMQES